MNQYDERYGPDVEWIDEGEQKEDFDLPSPDAGTTTGKYFWWVVLYVGSMSLLLLLLAVTEGWFGSTPIVRSVM